MYTTQDHTYKVRYKTTKFIDFVHFKVQKSLQSIIIVALIFQVIVLIQQTFTCTSTVSDSNNSVSSITWLLSHRSHGTWIARCPIPSQGTFPKGFSWEFHSYGQVCELPMGWLHFIIVPFHKPNKPTDLPCFYRPIYL